MIFRTIDDVATTRAELRNQSTVKELPPAREPELNNEEIMLRGGLRHVAIQACTKMQLDLGA